MGGREWVGWGVKEKEEGEVPLTSMTTGFLPNKRLARFPPFIVYVAVASRLFYSRREYRHHRVQGLGALHVYVAVNFSSEQKFNESSAFPLEIVHLQLSII